jgi:aspartyl-tRNA(Asn)/glutamyl-tRNA(Gln) amidotransferase subunit A
MCVGAIGSDTGGSIRIPAAFNGVAGLRPTIGRVSNAGSLHVSRAFDTLGPLARRVSDVARIFAAIAGHDAHDVMSVDQPLPNFLPR